MHRVLPAICLILLAPAAAEAQVAISLKSGYFFDDTPNELSRQFLADGIQPQTSALGLGVAYRPSRADDWLLTVSGMWGRGNERYRDTHVIRQDDEVLLQRDLGEFVRAVGGYRYEFTGVRSDVDASVPAGPLTPAVSAAGSLVGLRQNQVRHSARLGLAVDAPFSFVADRGGDGDGLVNDNDKHHRALASISAVIARVENKPTYVVDTDPGAGERRAYLGGASRGEWRFGPELTAGYRYVRDQIAVELRYRGAFLLNGPSTRGDVSAVHGLTLSVSYQLSSAKRR
jgi:hypothetical protein